MGIRERLREAMEAEVEVTPPEGEEPREPTAHELVYQIKADAVVEQFTNHPGRNSDGELQIGSPAGQVTFRQIETRVVDDVAVVDIWLGGPLDGEPDYRLINPPMLAEDPAGPVLIAGRRYREDPIAAIAEVLAHRGKGTGR